MCNKNMPSINILIKKPASHVILVFVLKKMKILSSLLTSFVQNAKIRIRVYAQ